MVNNGIIFNTFFEDEWATYVVTVKMLQTLQSLEIVSDITIEDVQHGVSVWVEVNKDDR